MASQGRPPPDSAPAAAPDRAPGPAEYANHFEIGFNAFEFLFDFAQDYGNTEGAAGVRTRIVTAPAYAKVFRGLLDRSIADYEATFGPIAQPASSEEEARTDERVAAESTVCPSENALRRR